MNTQEERNQYIVSNLKSICKMCTLCVRNITRRYPTAEYQELKCYAMEGIILALDKAQNDPKTLNAYLYRSTYLYTLGKAFELLGITRIRSKNKDCFVHHETIATEPETLDGIIEEGQYIHHVDPVPIQDIISRDVLKWLNKELGHRNCYEAILLYILLRYDESTLLGKYKYPFNALRREIQRLELIYRCMEENIPYECYMIKKQPPLPLIQIRVRRKPRPHFGKKALLKSRWKDSEHWIQRAIVKMYRKYLCEERTHKRLPEFPKP